MVQKKEVVALFIAAALVAVSTVAHHTNAQSSGGPHPVCMKWQEECVQLQAQKKPCPPPPTCTESIGTGTCAGAICVGEKAKTQGGEEEALDKDLSKLEKAVKEATPGGGSPSGGSSGGGGQQGGQDSEPKASEPIDKSAQETFNSAYDYSPSGGSDSNESRSVADEIAEYAKLPAGGGEGGAAEGAAQRTASELDPDDVGGLGTWSPSGDQGAQRGADEKNPSFAESTFSDGNAEANTEDRGPFERAFDAVKEWAGQKLEDLGDAAGKLAEDIYKDVFGGEEARVGEASEALPETPREAYQQAYRSCTSGGGGFSECSAAGRAAYDAASAATPIASPSVEPLLGTGRQTEGLTTDRSGLDSMQGGAGEPVTGWNTPRIDTTDLVEQVASDLTPTPDLTGVGQPLEELQQRLAQEAPEVPTPDAQAEVQQQAPGEQGAVEQDGFLRESLRKAMQEVAAGMDRFAKEVEGMREGLLMTGEKGGGREGLPTTPERLVQAAQMNPELSVTGQPGPSARTALTGEEGRGEPGFSLIDTPTSDSPMTTSAEGYVADYAPIGDPDLDNQLREPSVDEMAGLPPIEQLQERLAQGAPEVPTPTQAELDAAPKQQSLLDRALEGGVEAAKALAERVADVVGFLNPISPAEAQPRGVGKEVVASTYGWDKGSGDSSTQPLASGSSLDQRPWVFAERSGKFGEKFMFTNPATGESVVLERADRGPYTKDSSGNYAREVDLSRAAAEEIGQGYTVRNIRMTPVSPDTPLGPVSRTPVALDTSTAGLPARFAESAVPASLNYSSPLLDTPVPGEIIGNPLSYETAAAGPSFTPSANDVVPAGLSYNPQQPAFIPIEAPAPWYDAYNNPFSMSEGLRSALQEAGESINRNFADAGRSITDYFSNYEGPSNALGESLTHRSAAPEVDGAAREFFSNYSAADNAFAERLTYDAVGQPLEELQMNLAQSAPEIPFEGGDYAPTAPVNVERLESILRDNADAAWQAYARQNNFLERAADALGLRTPPEELLAYRDARDTYTGSLADRVLGDNQIRDFSVPGEGGAEKPAEYLSNEQVRQQMDDASRVVERAERELREVRGEGGVAQDGAAVGNAPGISQETKAAADEIAARFSEEGPPSYQAYQPSDTRVERTPLAEPNTPEFFNQQVEEAAAARQEAREAWAARRSFMEKTTDLLGISSSPEYRAMRTAEDLYDKALGDSFDYLTSDEYGELRTTAKRAQGLSGYNDAANNALAQSVNDGNADAVGGINDFTRPQDVVGVGPAAADPSVDNLGGAPSDERIPIDTQPLSSPAATWRAIQDGLRDALSNMWGDELSNVPSASPELSNRPVLADVPNSFDRSLGVTSERAAAVQNGEGADRLAADYKDGSGRIDPSVDNFGGAPSAEDIRTTLAEREPAIDTSGGFSDAPAALEKVPEWAAWGKQFDSFARDAADAVAEAVKDATRPVWDSVARNAEALFASQRPPVFESIPDAPIAVNPDAAEFERTGEGSGGLRAEAPQRNAEYAARQAAEKAKETPRVAGFAQAAEPARAPGANATNFSEWNKATGQNLTRADREQLWKQSGANGAYRATEAQNNQLLEYTKRQAGIGEPPLGSLRVQPSAPAVGGSGETLSQWFGSRGEALPSVAERRALYTTFYGIGSTYSGTAAQNAQLLNALKARY